MLLNLNKTLIILKIIYNTKILLIIKVTVGPGTHMPTVFFYYKYPIL